MVDIHSHVLWGLDDGAQTLADSIRMIELAAAEGTSDIVATPHASPEYAFQPSLVAERVQELRAATNGLLTIHTGCDFHLEFNNLQDALEHPRKYTINHQQYLLVEFAELLLERALTEILRRLLAGGMTPVITHPERNRHLQRNPEVLKLWVAEGCLVQVTAQSLLGDFGATARSAAESLLSGNLIHVVASDGHDVERRPPTLRRAYEFLARRHGEELADALCRVNPSRIVNGEPWPASAPERPGRKKKWWFF